MSNDSNMIQNKKNNVCIDIIKSFDIILVVLGHSIQLGSGFVYTNNSYYFENYLFKVIYSFHMPIFMLVSGYLFYFSINRYSFKEILFNKFRALFIPILFWNVIITLLDAFIGDTHITLWFLFKLYCNEVIGNLWFLWAVLVCSLLVLIINKVFKDSVIVFVLVFIGSFFTTDILNFSLYKFMFPFFLMGYLFNKYNINSILEKKNFKYAFILIIVTYSVMLVFYTKDIYIYVSGFQVLGKESPLYQLYVDIYRIIAGLLGSIIVIYMFSKVSVLINGSIKRVLVYIGKNTLGIYIISYLLDVYLLPVITSKLSGINYLLMLAETIVVLIISLLLIASIKKVKILNMVLFGGRN